MVDYLYIACRSHSGSTLLEKLLGTAPDAVCLGEIAHFADYSDDAGKACGCGADIRDCGFWSEVRRRLGVQQALEAGSALRQRFPTDGVRASKPFAHPRNLAYLAALLHAPALLRYAAGLPNSLAARNRVAVRNHWQLVQAVVALSGAKLVVDKSMSASRMLELIMHAPASSVVSRVAVVHLVRDGRANVHSHMTRFHESVEIAARGFRRDNQNVLHGLKRLPAEVPTARLHYEALCESPERALDTLSRELGLEHAFDPHAIGRVQHTVGGNAGKLTGYARVRVDERWKRDLSPQQLACFEVLAGDFNRKLGYR